MELKTDFYVIDGKVYYVTKDPLDRSSMCVMPITKDYKELSYTNMLILDEVGKKRLTAEAIPLGIGWVPTNCDLKNEYPEIFL